MRLFADTHIHSCLSPCADQSMTPNNIVNMALIKGLDLIAVTDHNSADNLRAVAAAAEGTSLCVVPGLELESSEEVHVLAYFDMLEKAEAIRDNEVEIKKMVLSGLKATEIVERGGYF